MNIYTGGKSRVIASANRPMAAQVPRCSTVCGRQWTTASWRTRLAQRTSIRTACTRSAIVALQSIEQGEQARGLRMAPGQPG